MTSVLKALIVTATLVERMSRFLILVPLTGPDLLTVVGDAVIAAASGLPAQIRRPLNWDYGSKMARHAAITASGLAVYFAQPAQPVGTRQQRGPQPHRPRVLPESGDCGWVHT